MAADGTRTGWQTPRFEVLEDRIVLDAVPDVAIDGPGNVDIGAQDVPFTLTFDNTGTDSGYVPYIDLILPATGSDGDDGVTFDSASFLGAPIDTTLLTFDGAGQAIHPFAVDGMGNPIVVTGTPGDTLVVLELPYGSFSPGNPPVDIDLVLDFSNLADLDDTFAIEAIPGFALGEDPLDNPTSDAPIRGTPTTANVGQDLFTVSKANDAPESDAATGPSYPYTYTLTVDVADGQTLSNFVLTDTLPTSIVYLGGLNVSGGTATSTSEPTVGALVTTSDNQLVVEFASITNSVTVEFDYYIEASPSDDPDPLINTDTGDEVDVTNSVVGTGTWDPLDGRDPIVAISDGATDTVQARSLAIQKTNAVLVDNQATGPTPGDIYEFTLNVQVSDYFTYGDLVVTDILGNGWDYEANSASFTFVEEGSGSTTPTSLTPFEDSTFTAATGETTNEWDLSAAMASLAGADGILRGDIAQDGTSSGSQTTVQITYRAMVLDQYPGSVPGNNEISQGDLLGNDVTITADVLDNTTLAVLGTEDETSGTEVTLATGAIESKSVFAVNGSTSFDPTLPIAAGDEVTFSVVYNAPLGSFEELDIVDNLPQNVFDATEVTVFNAAQFGVGPTTAPPAAGEAIFGPTDGFFALSSTVPGLSVDAPNNGVTFDFSNLSVDPRGEVDVEILFTVTVVDAIFAQNLLLTNQATAFETDSFGNTIDSTAIAQFVYSEPLLEITKGIVAFDAQDGDAALTGAAGPVAFNAPTTTGNRFTGTINSAGLDGTPIDADLNNVDANDTVTFAVVVENVGTAPDGAFDVTLTDTIPAGFIVPTTLADLNFNISYGDGSSVALAPGADPFDLFNPSVGLELADSGTSGAIAAFDGDAGATGDNVVIITYDLVIDDAVTANEALTNTAAVTNYNANENGVDGPPMNRVPPGGLSDTAVVTTETIEIDKVISDRQFGEGNANELLVGEDLSYTITIDLIEGTIEDAIFTDTATQPAVPGLEILGGEIVSIGSSISNTGGLSVNDTATAVGNTVTFNFGDLTVASDNTAGNETIEIRIDARVPDDQVGSAGQFLQNRARFEWDGGQSQDFAGARLTEPTLTMDKTAGPATVRAGDTVNYSVAIDNVAGARDAPAYDLRLTDTLDSSVVLDTGSIQILLGGTNVTGTPGYAFNILGPNAFEVIVDVLNEGEDLVVNYEAEVIASVVAGATIPNTANVTFDSTPEDEGEGVTASDDSDDRDYALSDDASVTTAVAEIDKQVFSSSNPDTAGTDLAINEEVTFQIVVTLPEGISEDVVLQDVLPTTPGTLQYVSASVIGVGGNISGPDLPATIANSGTTTTFDFGTLTNIVDQAVGPEDLITVQVTALVTDIAANAAGDTLTNTATLFFTDGNGNAAQVQDTASVDLVEPVLDIDKAAAPTAGDAGDVITYTVTSTNSGGAPAYDIVIDDDLADAGLAALTSSTPTIRILDGTTDVTPGTPDDPSVAFSSGALQAVIPVLDVGQTIEIVYQATITDAALFSSPVPNTAEVTRFDSDPAGGPADDNGRVFDTNRPGYTVPSDDAEVQTPDASLDKTLTDTSDANTTGSNVAVGETLTYELVITVPQGTADLTLTDVLPDGLAAQTATFLRVDNDPGITSDITLGSSQTGVGTTDNITIAANGDSVTFDFGTVVVTGENDTAAVDTEIVVQVTALVEDVAAVADGATLQNTATLEVTDPGNPGTDLQPDVQATETVTVIEPVLDIGKAASPTTADAGDVITYTVTSTNSGNAPAYDIVIDDDLADTGLAALTGGTLTINILGGTAPTGADIPSVVFSGGALQAIVPVLNVGQTIEIVYQATITDAALFSSAVPNTAELTRFDTDPAGGPTDDNGRVFDTSRPGYTVPSDDAEVQTPDASLTKTLIGSSDTTTPGDEVGVGEVVTYELVVTVPQGTADLTLTDALPDGLAAQSATFVRVDNDPGVTSDITVGSSQTGVGTTDNITIAANGDSVTFDFGTVVVTGENDTAAVDTEIVVQVTALVEDVAAVSDTAVLQNTATLEVTDPSNPGTDLQPDVQATETVTAVEPEVTLVKASPIGANPGDTVPYTITLENTGTGPAYDLQVEDTLADPSLSLATGTIQVFLNTTLLAPQPAITETAPDGFLVEGLTLEPGDTIVIAFDVLVDTLAPPAQTFLNTATATFDTVEDGNPNSPTGRTGTATDTEDLSTVPILNKEPVASSFGETDSTQGSTPFELSVGEEVTYRYELIFPEVAMDAVILVDQLPEGTEFVSSAVIPGGVPYSGTPGITVDPNQRDVTFDFGPITNPVDGSIGADDVLTFEVTARVVDVAAATAGATLTNDALLTITPQGEPPLDTQPASADVVIVEPLLTLDKSGPLVVEPGGLVNYTLEITNIGPLGGSAGPAYDVIITDSLPPEITLNTGTLSFSDGSVVVGSATAAGFTATLPVLDDGQTLTVTYTGTLSATATAPESFENTATVDYDSAPGNNPDERDYPQLTDDHRVATPPLLDKSILSTSVPQTGSAEFNGTNPDVNIGEEITYELVISLPEIPTDGVVLTDTLPTGLSFISADITFVGSEISGVTVNDEATVVSTLGQDVVFDFGAIDNAFSDGVINGNDEIRVTVTVQVDDLASVNAGDVLTNDASLVLTPEGESALPPVVAAVSVDVVEPAVSIDKVVSDPEPDAGDTITYTVTVTNDPTATGPALNLVVQDPLPSGLSLTGTVTTTGAAASVTSGSGATLAIAIPVLQPGETVTITYDVFVGFATPVLSDVINTATVTGTTSGDPNDPGRPIIDNDTAIIEVEPAPAPVFDEQPRLVGGGIDDAQFLPILLIDPIYTGTAEYGANVTISLYQWDGSLSYVRNVVADAGGHWIAIFPRVTLDSVDDDFHQAYERSVLFREPVNYLDDRAGFDRSGAPIAEREFFVGTQLDDDSYTVQVNHDRPSTLPQDRGMFNARVFFAPATIGEPYARGDVLSVDEVFEGVAELSVERLYQASVDPLATGLNRFSYEFLAEDTAIPGGSAR